jgi:hypothetical protein
MGGWEERKEREALQSEGVRDPQSHLISSHLQLASPINRSHLISSHPKLANQSISRSHLISNSPINRSIDLISHQTRIEINLTSNPPMHRQRLYATPKMPCNCGVFSNHLSCNNIPTAKDAGPIKVKPGKQMRGEEGL